MRRYELYRIFKNHRRDCDSRTDPLSVLFIYPQYMKATVKRHIISIINSFLGGFLAYIMVIDPGNFDFKTVFYPAVFAGAREVIKALYEWGAWYADQKQITRSQI